jgi:hypothetical protein
LRLRINPCSQVRLCFWYPTILFIKSKPLHWKYIEWQGFRPQLFNLKEDPEEFFDLGKDPGHAHLCSSLKNELMTWMKDVNARVTLSDQEVANRTDKAKDHGIYYGTW